MPRSRGAAATRSETRRQRGEHDNKTKTAKIKSADERRAREHARAGSTTDSLQLFINSAMKYPLLTGREEIELAKRIEKGDLAAKEKLINSNLRLVIKFARRYQGHGLDLGDIVQEAMLGLIRAAEKFDWRRGYKFSTYAVLWIKQSIQRGLDNSGRAVRIPAHIAQRERTVNRITAELTTKLDREPTDEEVAREAKLPLDEVMATRDLTRVTTSLDQPVGDGDTTFGELNAESTEALEEDVLVREQERAVDAALERLPDQERQIIKARFGTGGRPERPLRDAAREVGVTQEQARRLEERALRRLSADGSLSAWRDAA
ncbi:MAG: RNA polymerase sigma factor RpoD/SigA [Actinobacteria bacterium]|nr:RNA polymerase sigma factor RpoD/SigA [Actinomycetota bacterium]